MFHLGWMICLFSCCQQVLEWTGPGPAGIKKAPSLQSPGWLAAPAPKPGTTTPRRPRTLGRVRMENSERSRRTPLWPRTSVRWVWADRTVYLQGEDTLQTSEPKEGQTVFSRSVINKQKKTRISVSTCMYIYINAHIYTHICTHMKQNKGSQVQILRSGLIYIKKWSQTLK